MTFKFNPTPLPYSDILVEQTDNCRYYTADNGNKYPSITSVLSIESRDSIAAWKARVGEEEANRIGRKAAWRGTQVHEAVEMYLQNVNPTITNPLIRQGFNTLKTALDDHVDEVYGIEVPLFSHHLELGMRIDACVSWDGVRTLFDAKTSKVQKKKEWISNYFMQTCAGAIAFEERTGIPVPQLAIAIACDDNPMSQIFVEKRDDWVKPLLEVREKYREEFGR